MSKEMNVKPNTRSQSAPAQNTDANRPELRAFGAVLLFAVWSLRGRMGQLFPVTIALLLIAGAAQGIGALHDVSSTLTHQQIAHSWRNTYDLLVRPQDTLFFLQAEDGIRNRNVTGVQTCALPICASSADRCATPFSRPIQMRFPVSSPSYSSTRSLKMEMNFFTLSKKPSGASSARPPMRK